MRSPRRRAASSPPVVSSLALLPSGGVADRCPPVVETPRDTVTLSPSLTPELCSIKVWDERGGVACEVHVARKHVTPEILTRILTWVRSWEDEPGAGASGEERATVALVVE